MKYNRFVSKCIVVFDLNLFLPLVILLGLYCFFLKPLSSLALCLTRGRTRVANLCSSAWSSVSALPRTGFMRVSPIDLATSIILKDKNEKWFRTITSCGQLFEQVVGRI